MLRRAGPFTCTSFALKTASLSGNRIVGIRREDKNVWERRVPLIPDHVQDLLKYKQVDRVIVQPSTTRCYHDEEYAQAGAEINEDLSDAGTVLAVKEVPGNLLLPDRTYMFFSHTIKAQGYNMPLLDTIVASNVRLIDYERILGPDGRIVKFGPHAGYAGVIDTLNALGLALMTRGFATPFLNVSLSREYRSLETARESIRLAGDRIRTHGIPAGAAPIIFGVTGSGSVSMAAQEILHLLPCKYVEVEDLPRLAEKTNIDNKYIYVCVIKAKDMAAPKDRSKAFSREEYYAHPETYEPVFHERVAPYLSVLITGHYWEPRFPRMLTTDQARHLVDTNRFPWLVLSDITCDIGGSIEFFVKSTSIQNPFYVYNLVTNQAADIQDFHGDGVVVLGVDHLPAEFPREASTSFGNNLKPLIPLIASSSADVPLQSQRTDMGKSLFNAMVTMGGALTPNYEYITDLRKKIADVGANKKGRNIVVFGSGMMSAPAVFALLVDKRNTVTIIDAVQKNLEVMQNAVRKSEHDDNQSRVRYVRASIDKIDAYLETMIRSSDVVVSLLPAPMHATIAEYTIRHKRPLVTASYISPGMEALREKASQSGTVIVNEMGLDPGIDLMTSAALINKIKAAGGNVQKYVSLCGALPAPENSDCPMGYKFSWSPQGVLTAASRPFKCKVDGEWYDVPGDYLYYFPQPVSQFKGLDLYWLPNGDATKYADTFDIADASTIVRGTIRYPGFAGCIRAYKVLGMLDGETSVPELVSTPAASSDDDSGAAASSSSPAGKISWPDLIAIRALGQRTDEPIEEWLPRFLKEKLAERWATVRADPAFQAVERAALMTPSVDTPALSATAAKEANIAAIDEEVVETMQQFRSLGFLNPTSVALKTPQGTVITSLCRTLIHHLSYRPHERDYVIMYHRVVADFPKENKRRRYDMTLTMRGKSQTLSATAETVGIPVGLTAQMVLDGKLSETSGLVSPTNPLVYESVLANLGSYGIKMKEDVRESDIPE